MLRLRDALFAVTSFALCFTLVSGCGTEAQAIDECRDIEQARCEAGHACGLVDDVAQCKRFFRDHCLHGMSVGSPGQAKVNQCVNTIKAAGACAQDGADVELSACVEPVTSGSSGVTLACDIVLYPERTTECAFLAPDAEIPDQTGADAGEEYADGGDQYAATDSGTGATGAGGAGAGGDGSGGSS